MEAIDIGWRKSSYSGNGGNCVEVADRDNRISVRDTQDRTGPTLKFSPDAWRRLVNQLKSLASQYPPLATSPIPGGSLCFARRWR